jgi:peptidoglycan/LPS O-acetylase OafA/YrhL
MQMPAQPEHLKRFDVLNSFRGIGAAIVVGYHINFFIMSHLSHLEFLANAYMMLDFFFVLSGFVITHGYQQRLLEGYPLKRFVFRRFMRIYPIHIFVLLCFVALELLKFVVPMDAEPFSSPFKSFESLLANIFLVQSMATDVPTWNGPSWSISVEFYTYIIYALSLLVFRKRIWMMCLATAIFVPVYFYVTGVHTMDLKNEGAFLRSIYGFGSGVFAYHLYLFVEHHVRGIHKFMPYLEWVIIAGICAFFVLCGGNAMSLLSPLMLLFCCVIFAFESGAISRFLKNKIFMIMALLSYSVYMLHYFLLVCLVNGTKILQMVTGLELFKAEKLASGYGVVVLNAGPWLGDLLQLLVLVGMFACAYVTCRFIELPMYGWSKKVTRGSAPEVESPAAEIAEKL